VPPPGAGGPTPLLRDAEPTLNTRRTVRNLVAAGVRVVVVRAGRDGVAAWNAADWREATECVCVPDATHLIFRTHGTALGDLLGSLLRVH